MSAASIITSVVTGGSNSHATVSEEANAYATDFVTQGVIGTVVLNTGSGGSGSFCINADSSPDMGITAVAGVAYVSGTPSSQDPQVLRARMTSNYTSYTINANSSGTTQYDWIYLSLSTANAANPSVAADNVITLYTSRSSSNSSDSGSPPTYGLLLAIVTVANGATSITNSNISDQRSNSVIGSQGGSIIVTQPSPGNPAVIQTAGTDGNINLDVNAKGTGTVVIGPNVTLDGNISLPTGSVTPTMRTGGFKAGTFTTTTGTQIVPGVGFTSKLVKFTYLPTTNAGNFSSGTGAADGTSQWTTAGATSSGSFDRYSDPTSHCVSVVAAGSSTPTVLGHFGAFNSDGFSIVWDTAGSVTFAYECYA